MNPPTPIPIPISCTYSYWNCKINIQQGSLGEIWESQRTWAEGENKADSVKISPTLPGKLTQVNSIGQQVSKVSLSHAGAVNARNSTGCSSFSLQHCQKNPFPSMFSDKGPIVRGVIRRQKWGQHSYSDFLFSTEQVADFNTTGVKARKALVTWLHKKFHSWRKLLG